MAKKDSELPAGTVPLDGTELIAIVQGAQSKKATVDQLIASLGVQGANIAAAATVPLASATGDYVHVTGTGGPITSFGTAKAGLERTLVHDATHTLTHGANIINLGGVNITMSAGDISQWRNEGGTVWRMIAYRRADGQWIPAADIAYDVGSAAFRIRAVFALISNLSGAEFQTGIQSATITADTNDYSVSANTRILRIGTDATQRSVTGFAGGASGRRLTIFNTNASTPLLLKHSNASSLTENRMFLGGSDLLLAPGAGLELWYDGTTSRWRSLHVPQSGVYTPALTNDANVAASGSYTCRWMRVGNVVTVSGRIDVTCTAAANTLTRVYMSLPVPTSMANDFELAGAGTMGQSSYQAALALGDAVNDRARLQFLAAQTASAALIFTFTYTVN